MIFRYEADGAGFKVWALDGRGHRKSHRKRSTERNRHRLGHRHDAKVSASADEIAAFFATPEGRAAFAAGDPGDTLIDTCQALTGAIWGDDDMLKILGARLTAGAGMAALLVFSAEAAELQLKRVMLSSGGVGCFEYQAQVEGWEAIEIPVPSRSRSTTS